MGDPQGLYRVPVQWTILGGWLLASIGFVIWSAVQSVDAPCDTFGWGCDPALAALAATFLVGPPFIASVVLVALVTWLIGRRAAIWSASTAPPVLVLLFGVAVGV